MSKIKIFKLIFVMLFLLASMLHSGPSVKDLINEDFKAGKISLDDAVVLKALAVRAPWILPKKYKDQTDAPARDGTPLVWEVLSQLKQVHPDVQEYVKFLLAPRKKREGMPVPTLSTVKLSNKDIALESLFLSKEKAKKKREEYVTPEEHFIIYYYKKGTESVHLSYVEEVGRYLEASWEHEINILDYDAPDLGGNKKVDVYIIDLPPGKLGISHAPTLFSDGYIELDYDYSWVPSNDDPGGKAVGALKVTTAYELFHQIQYNYFNFLDFLFEGWWSESSARFMEDEVFDETNLSAYQLGPFFKNTHVTIDNVPGGYATVLINKFLMERYNYGNPDIIKEVLEGINLITNAEESMKKVLQEKGYTLADCFRDFALWNFFTGSRYRAGYYEEGELYPTFYNFQNTHSIGTSNPSIDEQTGEVDNLAANYYRITPDPNLNETKTLSIQAARNHENVLGRVVVRWKDGNVSLKNVNFDSEDKARVEVKDFSASNIIEVVLILSNGDEHFAKKISYSAKLVTGLDLIFVIDTTGSIWDDIANVKASSTAIVNLIDKALDDYRIAVVDYRDFPVSLYGTGIYYPYHAVLPFSTDKEAIIGAIQGLSLGNGLDWDESVYSALIRSIQTEGLTPWRAGAEKKIIILGDAPPHDPEPFTNYTLSSVVDAAGSIVISPLPPMSAGKNRLTSVSSGDEPPVSIFSITIGYDSRAYHYFSQLSEQTGGKAFKALNASDVVEKIIEAIGEIEEPNENHPPECSGAVASVSQLWPPNHKMKSVKIVNVFDPDGDPVYIKITGITQDEPVFGSGKGDKSPDGEGVGTDTAWLRAERYGKGDSRVYRISFVAYDDKGAECSGTVMVCVPHDQGLNTVCIDDGEIYDSTVSSDKK